MPETRRLTSRSLRSAWTQELGPGTAAASTPATAAPEAREETWSGRGAREAAGGTAGGGGAALVGEGDREGVGGDGRGCGGGGRAEQDEGGALARERVGAGRDRLAAVSGKESVGPEDGAGARRGRLA